MWCTQQVPGQPGLHKETLGKLFLAFAFLRKKQSSGHSFPSEGCSKGTLMEGLRSLTPLSYRNHFTDTHKPNEMHFNHYWYLVNTPVLPTAKTIIVWLLQWEKTHKRKGKVLEESPTHNVCLKEDMHTGCGSRAHRHTFS